MEFPAFLFAGEEAVIDRATLEGEAWAAAWQRTGALPAGALRPIAPGELVILDHGSLDADTPRWRLFGAAMAIREALDQLDGADRDGFERFTRGTPWGALGMCIRLRAATATTLALRARDLFAMWEPLARLRYIGAPTHMPAVLEYPGLNQDPIGLDAVVEQLFRGALAMWGPQLGPTRVRLELALDAMATATRDEAIDKVLGRIVQLARTSPRTRDSAAASPAAVAMWLAQQDDDTLDRLVPGEDLMRVAVQLSRSARSAGRGVAPRAQCAYEKLKIEFSASWPLSTRTWRRT